MNLPQILISYENFLLSTIYYFSTATLINTFWQPWKRQFWKKQKRGFHPSEILFIIVSNFFSRIIGAIIRLPLILLGLLAISGALIFGLPLVFLLHFLNPNSSIDRKKWEMRPLFYDLHFGYTPIIDRFSSEIYDKKLPLHLFGRENEIMEIRRTLHKDSAKNVLIVGPAGSGRHALLSYLSYFEPKRRFLKFNYVSYLKDKKTEEERQGALLDILSEAEDAGNVALIFDNFEKLLSFENVFFKFLESRNLTIVGISTFEAYHREIILNENLMKYFFTVAVSELSKEVVFEILADKAMTYYREKLTEEEVRKIHNASYEVQALEGKHQPEAALTLLDEFISFKKTSLGKKESGKILPEFLSTRLKVPTAFESTENNKMFLDLEKLLETRVIAQKEALAQVADALRRKKLNLASAGKPIGSFLFLGPTGVGKTETAKALAGIFFKDEKKLLRFDMARFQMVEQINKLRDELASLIRKEPYGVLLLDEIEKANSELLDFFLTVLDEGYFQDATGAKIPCSNLIVIGTSNAGSEYIREEKPNSSEFVEFLLKRSFFAPEFLNRFDSVVVFNSLNNDALKEIAKLKLDKLNKRLSELNVSVPITDDLLEKIITSLEHPEFGAREIERAIAKVVENPLAKEMLMKTA